MRGTDIEQDVAQSFAVDVAEHRLMVRHDQGLYRHLVFERLEHAWNGGFELVSTPGTLTIVGGHGAYTFRRVQDMFQFFRSNPDRPHRINASYWAEKTYDGARSVQVYSEAVLRQRLGEPLRDAIAARDALQREFDEENQRQLEAWREELEVERELEGFDEADYPAPEPERDEDWPELIEARKLVDEAQELVGDYDDDGQLSYEDGARRLLAELERIGLVGDTWEWDLSDWDFHFLWCLNAIAWGIQQYDRAVRAGLHQVRTGPVSWDTPLPTTPPVKPEPAATPAPTPVKFEVTMGTTHPAGAHTVSVSPQGGVL